MPSFDHRFDPPGASHLGAFADLTAREVEDAGLFEVLQTPGAALGSWTIFGALLDATTTDFKFREPLGLSREVKTALSGLFGRFVARAYAVQHLNYTHFAHIHSPPMALTFGGGTVVRVLPYDLPDWAAWNGSNLAIIEAKGSHSWAGPAKTLAGAYAQSQPVEITIGGRTAPFKRYAIATRWGFATIGPDRPMLWVQDPQVEGADVPEDAVRRLGIGIAQRHYAALLKPLGHSELGDAFTLLATAATPEIFEQAQHIARDALNRSATRELQTEGVGSTDGLIGGFVTKAGPVPPVEMSETDQETLVRFGLRPAFVGIELQTLKAAIEGSVTGLSLAQTRATRDRAPDGSRTPSIDKSGTWVFRPDEDAARLVD